MAAGRCRRSGANRVFEVRPTKGQRGLENAGVEGGHREDGEDVGDAAVAELAPSRARGEVVQGRHAVGREQALGFSHLHGGPQRRGRLRVRCAIQQDVQDDVQIDEYATFHVYLSTWWRW